jgi:hypothetical protein
VSEGDEVEKRLPRPRALTILTVLGLVLAAGALIAITAMTAAAAAVPPNLSKALEAQKRKAAEQPRDASVFNDLGNLLLLAGQADQAEAAYRHAVDLDQHRPSAQFNLALLLQQQGRVAEARQLYEKVAELEPRHAWAHYQLGVLAERRGDKSRAVREYAQAFRLDPQLAFRQVNPQIVDNGLVTESLLQAYRRSSAGEAPAIYDDPSRIRELMVPTPKEAAEAKAAEAPAAAIAAPAGAAGRTSVLRPRDLPSGTNLGQATPPGTRPGTAGRPGMQGMPTGYVPPNYQPPGGDTYQGRRWARPNPNPNLDGTQPGTVVTPPPAGLYYKPQVTSTGRLGTEIVPQE